MVLGVGCTASGNGSTAMGISASTNNELGSFVYGDASSVTLVKNTAANQFMVRAAGGTIFYSNSALTAGVSLAAGGSGWNAVSDKKKKENFREIAGEDLLAELKTVPVTTWNYKAQDPSIRHIGPMAQDLYAAFGLGENDTTINSIDIDGVNMAAIKAVAQRTDDLIEKVKEIDALRAEVATLKELVRSLAAHNTNAGEKLLGMTVK